MKAWHWGLAGLAVGFLGGRASVHLDDEQIRQELADYRSSLKTLSLYWLDLWKRFAERGEKIVEAERRGARARSQADRHLASADSAKAIADAAEGELAGAKTMEDLLRSALVALGARGTECKQCRSANDSLKSAAREDSTAKTELRGQLAELIGGHERDSTAIATGKTLIGKLERQVRGCRVPILKFPCPEPMGGLEVTNMTFDAGLAMPVDLGPFRVRFFVTKQVAKLRNP